MKSLIKWAGGKSWLRDGYAHLLPDPSTITGYREPFLGSAAVAANYLGKVPCELSDRNERLITMYRAVRDDPSDVIRILGALRYDREVYMRVRDDFNHRPNPMPAEIAAWFIYLNRCGFNGLYRESKSGKFNVPFGRYTNPNFCDEENIRAWAALLKPASAGVFSGDFEPFCAAAQPGEFVFFDPPYVPVSSSANFTEYQAGGFGPRDQARLVEMLRSLDARGVRWMLTNSPEARSLYSGWHVLDVAVARGINSKIDKRGKVVEIIVANYPLPTARTTEAA